MNETECGIEAIGNTVAIDGRYRTIGYGRVVTDLQSEVDIRSATAATAASSTGVATPAASISSKLLLLLLLRIRKRVVHPQVDVVGTGCVCVGVNKILWRSRCDRIG